MIKKIVFVTGTRADFGKLLPLAQTAAAEGHEVSFFVTGMHMMREFGETRLEVRRQPGFKYFECINHRQGDRQEEILSKTMLVFSDWIAEHDPDLVIVHGDRVESLACALACSTSYTPCAHIEGGEVSGTIDEIYRHCITKLANVHFASSDISARRIRQIGEDPAAIYVIGSPELDVHSSDDVPSLADSLGRYDIPFDDYGVLIFHSVTSELDTIEAQAEQLVRAVVASGKPFLCVASNNDPGSDQIMAQIRKAQGPLLKIVPSIRFEMFSRILRNARVVVGNSSLGVREAPFLGIASINIGTRQLRRSAAPSITNLPADQVADVADAITANWGRHFEPSASFGKGASREQFRAVIQDPAFWQFQRQKLFFDDAAVT